MRVTIVVSLCLMLASLAVAVEKPKGEKPKLLEGVKVVQVDPTVIAKPENVKEDHAANQVADSLKRAFRDADFEIGDSPIRAHIVLNEFTSGSTAKRFMIGMGAGRSTVDCNLVIQDAEGKELYNKKIRVRGNLAWSSYQGGDTQRRQAVNSFEQRILEEIEGLK